MLTPEDKQDFESIVQKIVKESEDRIVAVVDEKIQQSENRIVAKFNEEITDLADVNHLALNTLDEVKNRVSKLEAARA